MTSTRPYDLACAGIKDINLELQGVPFPIPNIHPPTIFIHDYEVHSLRRLFLIAARCFYSLSSQRFCNEILNTALIAFASMAAGSQVVHMIMKPEMHVQYDFGEENAARQRAIMEVRLHPPENLRVPHTNCVFVGAESCYRSSVGVVMK